ncbi:MAG: hypothetical protein AB7N91_10085 [Candidatus Tectimicrobiota bacterium]
MEATIPHRVPTLQHAIADLTGYEDADTLRWQPPCTGTQDSAAGTGPDGRAPRGQAPAPTGSPASWPTSEAPASMNVKLKVGNMELMYTARDTNDRDLQDRMTRLLPWLAEVMAACEVNYTARQQAAKQTAEPSTPPPPPAPTERTLDEQIAAAAHAAQQAQRTTSSHGQRQTPARDPAAAQHVAQPDNDPSWCTRHQVTMTWHNGNERGPGWCSHRLADGSYCKGQ